MDGATSAYQRVLGASRRHVRLWCGGGGPVRSKKLGRKSRCPRRRRHCRPGCGSCSTRCSGPCWRHLLSVALRANPAGVSSDCRHRPLLTGTHRAGCSSEPADSPVLDRRRLAVPGCSRPGGGKIATASPFPVEIKKMHVSATIKGSAGLRPADFASRRLAPHRGPFGQT